MAERASSDGATNKQCQPGYRQSTKTTAIETYTNFADKPKPTQSQGTEELLVMNVSRVTIELSELRARVLSKTDMRDIPVYKENCTPRHRQPEKVLPSAHVQVLRSDNQWNSRDYCFGVCKKADSVNRSGTGSCWNCLCWIVWGNRVSCLAAIVIKDRLHGIDLFTEDRRVCTNRPGLGGNPITLCDIIRVYTKMNENFKGGINNVMLRNNDPIDSRDHQRCVDTRHWSWTHASVRGKPIREMGRFGCMDTPVRDADWSVECSVGLSPVGDIRIVYIRDPVDRGQSSDAAPLTELFDFYTLLHVYNNCATGSALSWTFCNTVWNISSEEFTRSCSDFSVCQTMNGVVLLDHRSGVTFTNELCIPWDAPEAVVDINSVELVSLGSFPDKVGLFGRRKDAAVSRILLGRDSRSVRFLVPYTRGVERSYHNVTVVDMEDEREPMVTLADMTCLRELWPPEIFNHMKWFQQDLELMRKSAKREYSQSRPMPCKFCGKVIRVDMYRHVARLHLDLVQLWRCPIT